MKSTDLYNKVSSESGVSITGVRAVVTELAHQLARGAADGESTLVPGIGTFKVVARKARTGRNPKTGEPLAVPARNIVKFNMAATLKAVGAVSEKV